jgi:hypothetical protein
MVEIPGVGPFILKSGPEGLSHWRLARPLPSRVYPPSVPVNILLEGAEDLSDVNVALLASVLADVDDHIGRALTFVHERLVADPGSFGLTSSESYRDRTVDDVPLDIPQLNFYVGDEWILHFQRGRLPICEPYGLGVVFEGHDPVRIDDFTDLEAVE